MTTARDFPFCIEIDVIFRDIDALGHVNNAVYFTYMETARTRYVTHLLDTSELAAIPIIIAEATCTYRSPAAFGERLLVGAGVSRFGNKSFDLAYRIDAEAGDGSTRLVATGKTVQVMYDYQHARAIPVADDFKTRVQALQGDWQWDGGMKHG